MLNEKGITTLEILLVIGIIVLIGAATVGSYSSFLTRNASATITWDVTDALRRARVQAMSGRFDTDWGVHFEADSYVLFQGSTYSASEPSNEDFELPAGYSIDSISLNGGGSNIIFNQVDGDTEEYGSVTVVSTEGGNSKVISVNAAGTINKP